MHVIATATINPSSLQVYVGKNEIEACRRAANGLAQQVKVALPAATEWRHILESMIRDLPSAKTFEGRCERDVVLPAFAYLKSIASS